MPSAEKVEKVSQIANWFGESESVLVLRYRGLKVSEANELRAMVCRSDAQLRVVKNTLARIALKDTPHEELVQLIDGPVALVFAGQEPAQVAKLLKEYSRGRKEFHLLGGWFHGTLITGGQAEAIASLPSREVLLARMLGQAAAPLTGLVTVCAGPLRKLLGLFQALVDRAEPEAPAGEDAQEADVTPPGPPPDRTAPIEPEVEPEPTAEASPAGAEEGVPGGDEPRDDNAAVDADGDVPAASEDKQEET